MDRRSIIFVLLSTVILFGWMAFFPPTPPEDAAEENPAVAEQEGENEGDPQSDETDTGSEATTGQSSESSENTGTNPEAPPTFEAPHALVSLGSLAADSPYRMLVTLNSRGGTIEQIELADRLKSGQFRFKLVDDRAGYLGHLSIEPTSDAQGVMVGVVGPGTPADQAGLQAGDVITALGEQKVASPADYFGALNATSRGDELVVKVRRNDQALTLTAALLSRLSRSRSSDLRHCGRGRALSGRHPQGGGRTALDRAAAWSRSPQLEGIGADLLLDCGRRPRRSWRRLRFSQQPAT